MAMNERDFEEKRNFIRMTMNATAKLTVNGDRAVDVTCLDLSASGMSIRTKESLSNGTTVRIKIESPNAQFQSMDAVGTVVRCDSQDMGGFEVGLTLDTIN